jgi:hypothetical protein
MSAIAAAIVVSALVSAAASRQASRSQQRGIRRGQDLESEYRRYTQEQNAPFRELALKSAGLIGEDIMREPGTGPGFQRTLEKGSANLAGTLSKFGVLQSRGAGSAFGELVGNLTSADEAAINNMRLALIGGGGDPSALGPSIGRSSNLAVLGGASRASQISAQGNTFAQLALLYGSQRGGGGGGYNRGYNQAFNQAYSQSPATTN